MTTTARYIPVPIPVIGPDQPTLGPAGGAPRGARPRSKSTAQRHPINDQPPRLGLPSIKDTPTLSPHEIVKTAIGNCPIEIKWRYSKLIDAFAQYMKICDNSYFAARGIVVGGPCKAYPRYDGDPRGKNDHGIRSVTGPLRNRWHPERRAAWIARMHQLSTWYEANRVDGCTLITLTGYQDGLSWYDTLDNITEARTKLLKILRKYLGQVDYFWVIEPHTANDTGYPHIHLAVFRYVDNEIRDTNGEGMEDKLRRLYSEEWQTGSHTFGLDFQQMRGESSIKDLKNYLMKYISKGYVSDKPWSPGELIFNAHLYGATHGNRPPKPGEYPDGDGKYSKKYRLIGMSRNLSKLLKPEKDDGEDIIWLETDETAPAEMMTNPITGEEVEIEPERIKPLYRRQLIPDWLDWPCGYQLHGWGRPLRQWDSQLAQDHLTERQRRKLREDGYL